MDGSQQGPAIESPKPPLTLAYLHKQNGYRRVQIVCDMLTRNGELADYDDELANSVNIAKEMANGVDALSARGERARRYAEQLEAHMDEGGKFTVGNVRDLITYIKEIA